MRAALLAGLVLTAVAIGVTLSGAPSTVVGTNAIGLEALLGQTKGGTVCQPDESLPRGTSAIRLSLEAVIGPRVSVEVFSGSRLLTSGTRGSGWTAASVTVPVQPLSDRGSHLTLCFTVAHTRVRVAMLGAQTKTKPSRAARLVGGHALPGRISAEYLRTGQASWLSRAQSIARRVGLGRAMAGTWIAALVLLAMLALALIVSWLTVRELGPRAQVGARRPSGPRALRIPGGAATCALVACLNAACWSVITPPFQVPDETNHFAYVQVLAESEHLPRANLSEASPAMQVVLRDLGSYQLRYAPQHRALVSAAQQRKLERDMTAPLSRRGPGGAGGASSEPPLYYSLEVLPYELGSGGSLLEQLQLMRLLSTLMGAATALFAYLFVREALPGSRWAWTVGGLAVALFPMLGFMSGGVSPDAMLFAVCSALYYLLARAFRRGLEPRLAISIGLITAAGFLTKLNFVGFAPGVIVGLALLGVRGARRDGSDRTVEPRARLACAIAIAIAISPVLLYGLVNLFSGRPVLGSAAATIGASGGSIPHEISYVWQFYLPRLPGMSNFFPGVLTTRQLWFDGLVGFYGWADTLFPGWVYELALVPAGLIAALGFREILRRRRALHRRVPELAIYALTGVGVMTLVGAQSYASDVIDQFEPFWEPRYLLPMLGLWGLAVALAARGAGRRWGPPVGALLVVVLLAHDLFSQLQVIARYYA